MCARLRMKVVTDKLARYTMLHIVVMCINGTKPAGLPSTQ